MNDDKGRVIGVGILVIALLIVVFICTRTIQQKIDIFVVENGALSYEESVQGYIIREEQLLKGDNYKNGMVQIKTEGEKVSKGEPVFRYYSNGEDELNKKIQELDIKINEAIAKNDSPYLDSDIYNLEKQIQKVLEELEGINDLKKQEEYLKKIETYITKKSNRAGELSPAGSYIKQLIDERNEIKNKLQENSEIISATNAGVISYRVDGCEDSLGSSDLNYLNTNLLENLNLSIGTTIPQNSECGKVINNFYCYIACPVSSEKSMEAKEGDSLVLRLANSKEIAAKIEKIIEEDDKRIIIFKIKKHVEELIEYRKISLEIVWWDYTGLKISNSAIKEENDLSYIYRNKAGYTDKVLVKILRQNDTFSIVTNYTKEELEELGFSNEEIEKMPNIKVYDEIIVSK